MSEFKYTKDHECLYIDSDIASIGITEHAREALGDLVFIELGEVGKSLLVGDEVGVVESVKTAAEVYSPVEGEIIEVNEPIAEDFDLVSNPVNEDGWLVKVKLSDLSKIDDLMDKAAYDAYLKEID